jgi:hypothetical protein
VRTEYRSPSRTADGSLLFSVAMKIYDNLLAKPWHIPAYSLPRKRILASRFKGNLVFT